MADLRLSDLIYRGLASTAGAPVDLATMVARPFGYSVPDKNVIGGSEWIGKQLEDYGLVSSARNPLSEFLASAVMPSPSIPIKASSMGAKALMGLIGATSLHTGNNLTKAEQSIRRPVRYTHTIDPMSDYGHAMFVDPDLEDSVMNGYGKYRHELDDSNAPHILDLKDKIESAFEENGFPDKHITDPEDITQGFNPKDIVNSAEGWDNWDWVKWIYDHVLEPNDIYTVKTYDGAVTFDKNAIKHTP